SCFGRRIWRFFRTSGGWFHGSIFTSTSSSPVATWATPLAATVAAAEARRVLRSIMAATPLGAWDKSTEKSPALQQGRITSIGDQFVHSWHRLSRPGGGQG